MTRVAWFEYRSLSEESKHYVRWWDARSGFLSEITRAAGSMSGDRSQLYSTMACRACISWHQSTHLPSHRHCIGNISVAASREYVECCYKWPSLPFDTVTSRVSASWCRCIRGNSFEPSELIYVRTNGQNRIHYCPSETPTGRCVLKVCLNWRK